MKDSLSSSAMIKAIIWDFDGVINVTRRFSERLSIEHEIQMDVILPMFIGPFQECLVGKADLKDILKIYIPKWGIDLTVDQVMSFWFDGEVDLDYYVLDVIEKLNNLKVKQIIFTNQEKYRTQYLRNLPEIQKLEVEMISSADVGLKKPDDKVWGTLLEELSESIEETILIDDDEENVTSAKEYGLKSILYKEHSDLKHILENI